MLHTILVTYHTLLGTLLVPPPPLVQGVAQEPEWVQHLAWIRVVALNMIAAINELRPVQVRDV